MPAITCNTRMPAILGIPALTAMPEMFTQIGARHDAPIPYLRKHASAACHHFCSCSASFHFFTDTMHASNSCPTSTLSLTMHALATVTTCTGRLTPCREPSSPQAACRTRQLAAVGTCEHCLTFPLMHVGCRTLRRTWSWRAHRASRTSHRRRHCRCCCHCGCCGSRRHHGSCELRCTRVPRCRARPRAA